uniref:Immediate early response 3-interacting protein 1 n=2 Tax=Odontoceti TaxID=9722 RepID=A0A8C6ALU3_MONMO
MYFTFTTPQFGPATIQGFSTSGCCIGQRSSTGLADVSVGRVLVRWERSFSERVLGLVGCRKKRRPWWRHVPCRGGKGIGWASGRLAMAFTLYSLLQAALLCVNAIAVLHEERFLKNIGWGTDQGIGGFGEEPGIKSQLMNLIRSVRTVMRVPLIIVNSIAIILLLLFG